MISVIDEVLVVELESLFIFPFIEFTVLFGTEVANLCKTTPTVTMTKLFTDDVFIYNVTCTGITVQRASIEDRTELSAALEFRARMNFGDIYVVDRIHVVIGDGSNCLTSMSSDDSWFVAMMFAAGALGTCAVFVPVLVWFSIKKCVLSMLLAL